MCKPFIRKVVTRIESEPIQIHSASRNLNFPEANATKLSDYYPTPSIEYPTVYNVSAGLWRDAHMLCLSHNLAKWRTEALRLPVWRYRFDHVASNLNSRGVRIGAFHGEHW